VVRQTESPQRTQSARRVPGSGSILAITVLAQADQRQNRIPAPAPSYRPICG
jgi:hypothetical protein